MRLIDADNIKIPGDANYKASVKRVIEQQPTVQQWIPVSERLPIGKKFEIKIDGEVYHRHVLVQCADEDIPICIAYYDTNAWFCACTNQELNVLAWMPLQEEYKVD